MVNQRFVKVMIAVSAIMLFSGCSYVNVTVDDGAQNQTSGSTEDRDRSADKDDKKLPEGVPEIETISLDPKWEYADLAVIGSGHGVLYRALSQRRDIVVAVNAGHGTKGGEEKSVYCHPDRSPKLTHGSNPKGSLTAVAVSGGMIFADGTPEAENTLIVAKHLCDKLIENGYDVLMIRDEDDVQLDNVARTVIANNKADILVSLHFDGDGLKYDKGCFYIPTPDEIKSLEPVSDIWPEHEKLGRAIIDALREDHCIIYEGRVDPLELTQTCYATVPAVVVELGNAATDTSDEALKKLADAVATGIEKFTENKE